MQSVAADGLVGTTSLWDCTGVTIGAAGQHMGASWSRRRAVEAYGIKSSGPTVNGIASNVPRNEASRQQRVLH